MRFQFHYDSINTKKRILNNNHMKKFQFHYDSINTMPLKALKA